MIKNLFKFVILFTAFSWAVSCSEQEFYEWNEPVEDEEINGSPPDKPKPEPNPNPNPNPNPSPEPEPQPQPDPEKPSGYAARIEVPKLKGGDMNLFRTWTLDGNVTYSYEYNCSKRHTNWVAFTFDYKNNQKGKGVDRDKSKWKVDTNIPAEYQTYEQDYISPYNRGHLVASGDRVYTQDANQQTFYYSNVSPQYIDFNSGIWNNMEEKVRKWAKCQKTGSDNLGPNDIMYVVKGGNINGTVEDGTLIKFTSKNRVAVPRYYFMAILFYEKGKYRGMGFYIDQEKYKDGGSGVSISKFATTIDDIEEKTGLDFFHNLDDNIEKETEKTYNPNDWAW